MKKDDSNSVTFYLQSLAKIPMLSRADELKYGFQMLDGRKKIASTFSKKNLKVLAALVEEMDEGDEERESLLALIKDPTPDNMKLLKEYLVHVDFDVLSRYCETVPKYKAMLSVIKAARDILINSNLRLVISVAKQYTNAGMEFEDLIQEGNVGLIKAVDKFDPRMESKLGTLATWWIRQGVIRSLSNKSRTIRVPVHVVDAFSRIYKRLSEKFGRMPTPEEMFKELDMPNLTLNMVADTMSVMAGPIALQTPVGNSEDGEGTITYENFLKDNKELVEIALSDKMFKNKLLELISTLSPREQKIIRLKIGA